MGKEIGNRERMENLSFNEFAITYVCSALNKMKDQPSINDFDEYVWSDVSGKLGIDIGLVKKLHHPFHWEFFLKGEDLSEYVQRGSGEKNFVRLNREHNMEDVYRISEKVIEKNVERLHGARVAYLRDLGR